MKVGDATGFTFEKYTTDYSSCGITTYELTDSASGTPTVPAGLTAAYAPSGGSVDKIDVDDVAIPGVRTFYLIVTATGASKHTFGPYSLTMSCTMGSGATASSNVVPTEPSAIST